MDRNIVWGTAAVLAMFLTTGCAGGDKNPITGPSATPVATTPAPAPAGPTVVYTGYQEFSNGRPGEAFLMGIPMTSTGWVDVTISAQPDGLMKVGLEGTAVTADVPVSGGSGTVRVSVSGETSKVRITLITLAVPSPMAGRAKVEILR